VDLYNDWFVKFAPQAYRDTRARTSAMVRMAMSATGSLRTIGADTLRAHPEVLPVLRMATCPPLAVDRLIGLAGVPGAMVKAMEKSHRLPPGMSTGRTRRELGRIGGVIEKLADRDILPWLDRRRKPTEEEVQRAALVIADRLCGAQANPIIRNAQEQRQLDKVKDWLVTRGYRQVEPADVPDFKGLCPGTFCFRLNVAVRRGRTEVNVPADVALRPLTTALLRVPMLIEAKSAGDFANVNKRRKEEAAKLAQLHETYGRGFKYVLFLGGYFDSGYLGYEASEGMDWVWEHRVDDFAKMGL